MWLLAWPVFCVLVGIFASSRYNRNGFGWAALSFLISPLFGFLFLVAFGRSNKPSSYAALAAQYAPAKPNPLAAMSAPPPEPRTDLIRAEARRRIEPRLAALFFLVGLVVAATAAQAGQGLTYGGATLCSVVLKEPPEELPKWGSWIMGYWSGLNSMGGSQAAAWTGEKLGGEGVITNSVAECVLNQHQTIQDAVNAAYTKAQVAGQ